MSIVTIKLQIILDELEGNGLILTDWDLIRDKLEEMGLTINSIVMEVQSEE